MFTIDVHTHIIPREMPDFTKKFGRGEYISLEHHEPGKAWMKKGNNKFREILANCWDPAVRVREMEAHKVETVGEYPDKFVGLGTVPLQDVKSAIKELAWCMENGMRGIQIGTNVNNDNLGDEKFHDFFAACERFGAAILIHPWQMMGM